MTEEDLGVPSPDQVGLPAKRTVWSWLAPAIAAVACVALAAVLLASASGKAGDARTIAKSECSAEAVRQTPTPQFAKVSRVLAAHATDVQSREPVIEQWSSHASLDDSAAIVDNARPYLAKKGYAEHTYLVSGTVDSDSTDEETSVSQVFVCWIAIESGKVVRNPTVQFASE